jgi:amino acid permease
MTPWLQFGQPLIIAIDVETSQPFLNWMRILLSSIRFSRQPHKKQEDPRLKKQLQIISSDRSFNLMINKTFFICLTIHFLLPN